MFTVGEEYTRDEIHHHLGGSKQAYLPTVSGNVVAICVTTTLNPRAPNVILCGRGPKISASGLALAAQQHSVPLFIKQGVNRWLYRGQFKAKASYSSGPVFSSMVAGSGRSESEVSLAIELA